MGDRYCRCRYFCRHRFVLDQRRQSLTGEVSGKKKIIAAVNKIDMVADKNRLLPYIDTLSRRYDFAALVPTSAKRRQAPTYWRRRWRRNYRQRRNALNMAERTTENLCLPNCCREKIFHCLGDELPHRIGVVVHSKEKPHSDMLHVDADIYVEKESQKSHSLSAAAV